MCGIIGILSPKKSKQELGAIKNGLKILDTRGPDDEGIWIDESFLLGHRRLAIINPSNASQPIISVCGDIIVVCNGEFYDFEELKKGLLSDYQYKTNSDSEILISLYLKFGIPGMMKYLRGEFAFLLYDKKERKLYAARDRFGIKPLVWYSDSKKVIIASKAKAIKATGVSLNWDYDSLAQVLTMQYPFCNRTYFKDIKQIKPGCLLEISFKDKDRFEIKESEYWNSSYNSNSKTTDFYEATAHVRNILTESIRIRMRGDAKICCHLSGGLDSSIIAGVMSRLSNEKVNCFSIVFPNIDPLYNEAEIARSTTEILGGEFHPVAVSQQDIFTNLSDAVYWSEGVAVNGHLSCKFLLNREISRLGFKVALTGEGADECFAGYSHLRQDLINTLPNLNSQLFKNLYHINKAVVGTELPYGESLECNVIKERLGFLPTFIKAKTAIGHRLYNLLIPEFKKEILTSNIFLQFLQLTNRDDKLKNLNPVYASTELWNKSALCNYILNTLGDGCEMAQSVEGRLPFLDHHLYEYSSNLPVEFKIKNYNLEKYILREAMKEFVSTQVYKRHKNAFQAPPLTKYFSPSLLNQVREEILDGEINRLNIFNKKKMDRFLSGLSQSDSLHQISIEPVVMLLLTINHLTSRFDLN